MPKRALRLHAMWTDGTFYIGDPDATNEEVAASWAAKEQRLSYAQS